MSVLKSYRLYIFTKTITGITQVTVFKAILLASRVVVAPAKKRYPHHVFLFSTKTHVVGSH